MKYVLNDDGSIKVTDGKPTVVGDDKKEFGIDAIGAQDKITAITTESNDRRRLLGEANATLKTFAGIEDPAAAIDAIQKVLSMDKDQATALDKQKGLINATWKEKQDEWDKEKTTLTGKLFDATVGANFATSKVIEKTVLPPDIAKATFGKHFNPDGTANDSNGKPIYSKASPGEFAKFDEAMGIILEAYPDKDAIMRGSGAGGGGGHTGGNGDSKFQQGNSLSKIESGLEKIL